MKISWRVKKVHEPKSQASLFFLIITKEQASLFFLKDHELGESFLAPSRGVIMADLVSFGLQKLWDLLSQEYEQFQGVEDQVTELKSDLNTLRSFLKDAYAKKHTSAMVRNCVEVIKDIIYDAEDIIETFILKDELAKNGGIKKRIRRLACTIPERREIALEIGGISKRISKVIRDMKSFGVQRFMADGGYITQPLHDRQREMREEFARKYKSDLVGLEENVKKLVGYLVEEEQDNVQVVSITGMGGLGKTTLARQVFNDDMVKNKFDGFAWVCVSQEFTRISVWQTILRTLRPPNTREEEKEILEMTEATLQDKLFGLLETSKSLIVLDDIWKEEDWNLINPIFPAKKGWKVLLTSRNENVAARGDATYINFKPECLTIKDSWTLFQRIAFQRKDASESVDEEMEEMGNQMIKHCGGLPLAVKVLGSLLAEKYTFRDWRIISESIGSHIVEGRTDYNDDRNSSFNHVLSLSFEELPSYLKHCFLYLAHFPEDHKINVEKLSYYWAADGLPSYHGETIRDAGDSYMEELVRRNMVISERDVTTLRFETCQLHDMMREICLFKAKEENFLHIVGAPKSPGTSRRFVSQNLTPLHVERDINNPKVRSLLVVRNYGVFELSGVNFKRLQLLRLLDLSNACFEGEKLPSSIGKLIHLRYLSLEEAEVSHIPSSLRNLKLLIYLNLNLLSGKAIFVPNVLMEMQELRYLALPIYMHEKTKLEMSNLVNLETLTNFSTENSSLEDLRGMARLRTLGIILTGERSLETLSAAIGGLKHLENLDIVYLGSKRMKVDGTVLEYSNIKVLELSIRIPLISDELRFPSRLTCLDLDQGRLEEDPMPILEKLLHLKEVKLRKSFCGSRMVCSGGGFPQLQILELWELEKLEEWIVREGSMPLLRTLIIWDCRKLKELPDGLRFITSLNHLSVYGMDLQYWKKRLSEGGEDYDKVQHIPSVTVK